jgi:hypothetical protein
MKVREMIKWLETQEQDAIVQVAVQNRPAAYQSYGEVELQVFNPENERHVDISECRSYPWAKGTGHETTVFIALGSGD